MSIMSLPEPSWPFGKDWMSMRPPDFSLAAAEMRSTICTWGCVGGSISPQRITVSWARRNAGAARLAAPMAAVPARKRRRVVVLVMVCPPLGFVS